ncbi:hypothetical protein H7R52_02615 [Weissella confusa]|uniref:Gram-positive cocci surface proteins LPxTG domain-containing protein n=1 Tax=Weissella confusa TaxID=1583 RepID=A0A923NGD7_WEICO|nr:hypothetical protein [Weissella confusa]
MQSAVAEAEAGARNVVVPAQQPTSASVVNTVTEPVTTVETAYVAQPTSLRAQTPTVYSLATKALQTALDDAKAKRTDANQAADKAIAAAKNSSVSGDPAVQKALDRLQAILEAAAKDSSSNLTADIIEAATKALEAAVATANNTIEAARNAANDLLGKTAPVSHEAEVANAITALKKVLDDPNASADQITAAATAALRDALQPVGAARTQANDTAKSLIDIVKPSAAGQVPAVQEALQKLQDIMNRATGDNADALTVEDIEAATKALQDAITNANTSREAARDAANDLMGKTAPVSHETNVATAKDALQKLLDDSTSTTADIENADATQALRDAVATAQPLRDAANEATDAATAAVPTDLAKEPTVQAALDALDEIQKQAAADQDGNLTKTKDIQAAIDALQTAQTTAANNQQAARDDAQDALSKTAPVSHEPAVADAISNLQKLLDDPTSTTKSIIQEATKNLNAAIGSDKTDRDAANTAGTQAIADAQGSDQSAEPSVQAAINNLKDVMATAATDTDSAFLTADIDAARNALKQAVADAKAAQDQARKDAAVAVASANPVSHELGTAEAISSIEAILTNPNATTADDIKNATQNLMNATSDDKITRTTANTNAQNAITDASNTPQADEPAVQDAIAKLQDIMKQAANDESDAALTADIAAALAALQTAVVQAAKEQAEARDNAADALARTAPVSNEKAVADAISALNKVLDDPAATTEADIEKATKALTEANQAEQAKRDAINDEADKYEDKVATSSTQNEPTVQAALDALNEIQEEAATDTPDTALTADIQKAIDDLAAAQETAKQNQTAARDAAADAIEATKPVSNEATVLKAHDALQKLLDNPASSTAEAALQATAPVSNESATSEAIANLQNVLNDTNSTAAKTSDQATEPEVIAAIKNLQDTQAAAAADSSAINAANGSNQADEPAVQAAEKALQDLVDQAQTDTPDALTADIQQAIKNLQDAVSQAAESQADARQADAAKALNETSPVSYEPDVQSKIDDLQKFLDDPASTADQINDATEALRSATETAINQRSAADDDAKADEIATAGSSHQANDQSVIDATKNLQDLIDKAKTGDAGALTEDIEKATQALKDAVAAAGGAQEAARAVGETTLAQDATPVQNEASVIDKKQALEDVLNNPESTPDEIVKATNDYNDAVEQAKADRDAANEAAQATAKSERDQANDDANTTISQVTDSKDDAVKQAVADLEAAQKDAANNVGTTQAIEDARQAVIDAVKETQAIKDATDALDNAVARAEAKAVDTAPVSQEPSVQDAQSALNDVLNDPNATTEAIDQAKQALQDAVDQQTAAEEALQDAIDQAVSEREAAETAGDDALNSPDTTAVATDDAVADAMAKLDKAMTDADNDQGTETIAALVAGDGQPRDVTITVTDATGNKTTKTVTLSLIDTAPVSQEQAVKDAQKALDDLAKDPNTTADDDTSVDQTVRYVYRDVQAPTVTTTKAALTTSKAGMPADEATFLADVGFSTTDNQQHGDSTIKTD